jgi:ankyrin repeat protein
MNPMFDLMKSHNLILNFRKAAYRIVFTAMIASIAGFARADSYTDFFRDLQIDNVGDAQDLLAQGFDPNAVDANGNPALYIALREKSFKIAALLIAQPGLKFEQRNPAGETPLMIACLQGDTDLVHSMVEHGASVDKTGWTPLSYAATSGHDDIVKFLLDSGAAVDEAAPNGTTPLMMAAYFGHLSTVQILLDASADPTLKNAQGFSALDLAQQQGHDDVVQAVAAAVGRKSRPEGSW